MDMSYARHERAALVASKAQTSSEIAALQAKVEEVCRAQFGTAGIAQSTAVATEAGRNCKLSGTGAMQECSTKALGQRDKELSADENSSGEDPMTVLLDCVRDSEERGRHAPEQAALDEKEEGVVIEEEEGKVNRLVVDIGDQIYSIIAKGADIPGEDVHEKLNYFSENQPAASAIPCGNWVPSHVSSLPAGVSQQRGGYARCC
jgi:hypothetical protein